MAPEVAALELIAALTCEYARDGYGRPRSYPAK